MYALIDENVSKLHISKLALFSCLKKLRLSLSSHFRLIVHALRCEQLRQFKVKHVFHVMLKNFSEYGTPEQIKESVHCGIVHLGYSTLRTKFDQRVN